MSNVEELYLPRERRSLEWNSDNKLPAKIFREKNLIGNMEHFLRTRRMLCDPQVSSVIRKSYIDDDKWKAKLHNKTLLCAVGLDSSRLSSTQSIYDTKVNIKVDIVKTIVMREGYVFKLKSLSDSVHKHNTLDGFQGQILEVLSQVKEVTLRYLEYICQWREAKSYVDTHPFIYEGNNYTIKLLSDLNFLADNTLIANDLNVNAVDLTYNPLMLRENLYNTSHKRLSPIARALKDVGSKGERSPRFEMRLRLRVAESVLLRELKANLNEDATEATLSVDKIPETSGDEPTKNGRRRPRPSNKWDFHKPALVKGSFILEDDDSQEERVDVRTGGESDVNDNVISWEIHPRKTDRFSFSSAAIKPMMEGEVKTSRLQTDSNAGSSHHARNINDEEEREGSEEEENEAAASNAPSCSQEKSRSYKFLKEKKQKKNALFDVLYVQENRFLDAKINRMKDQIKEIIGPARFDNIIPYAPVVSDPCSARLSEDNGGASDRPHSLAYGTDFEASASDFVDIMLEASSIVDPRYLDNPKTSDTTSEKARQSAPSDSAMQREVVVLKTAMYYVSSVISASFKKLSCITSETHEHFEPLTSPVNSEERDLMERHEYDDWSVPQSVREVPHLLLESSVVTDDSSMMGTYKISSDSVGIELKQQESSQAEGVEFDQTVEEHDERKEDDEAKESPPLTEDEKTARRASFMVSLKTQTVPLVLDEDSISLTGGSYELSPLLEKARNGEGDADKSQKVSSEAVTFADSVPSTYDTKQAVASTTTPAVAILLKKDLFQKQKSFGNLLNDDDSISLGQSDHGDNHIDFDQLMDKDMLVSASSSVLSPKC